MLDETVFHDRYLVLPRISVIMAGEKVCEPISGSHLRPCLSLILLRHMVVFAQRSEPHSTKRVVTILSAGGCDVCHS